MDYQNLQTQFIKFLEIKARSSSTIIAYKKDISQFFNYLSQLPADQQPKRAGELTTDLLQTYVDNLKNGETFTLKTVSRKINSLKTFFKFLMYENKIGINPAAQVHHPKTQPVTPRILTSFEYRAIRDVARGNLRHYTMIELLLQTGMRIGELSRLKRSDLFLGLEGKNYINIDGFSTLASRKIELNQLALMAIQDFLNKTPEVANTNSGYFFYTKTGKPVLIRNIRTALNRIFIKGGIKNATVNDLRNTFIVYQLQNGLKIEKLAQVVGHRKVSTTERYLSFLATKPEKTHSKINPL
jgi:site-specific recombinase XerD